MSDEYQICNFCVMDTSDPLITFDPSGRCKHCISMEKAEGSAWFLGGKGLPKLEQRFASIKSEGKGKEYDCILGLSGGADSSYVALLAHDWGLRPLALHVDAGWNSELAVRNIQALLDYTEWDLHTEVINWEEMRDLQLAYLRSGVANQDVPQDHAFSASIYKFASKHRIRYYLNGGNAATEGIFPKSWHWSSMDSINLTAIHKRFGTRSLHQYPRVSVFDYYVRFPFVQKISPFRPLNYSGYNKSQAMDELQQRVGWRPYPRKHGESVFTRFFQEYYLPTRFGFDKRRPHFSSQIVSQQITREAALNQLALPTYTRLEIRRDINFLCRKLRIHESDLDELLKLPPRDAREYGTWETRRSILKSVQTIVEEVLGKRVAIYS